jgi:hypothetical protein
VLKVERIIFELANTSHVRLSCSEMSKLQTIETLVHTRSKLFRLQYLANRKLCKEYRHTGPQLCKTVYTEAFNFTSQIPLYVWGKNGCFTLQTQNERTVHLIVSIKIGLISLTGAVLRHLMCMEKQVLQSAFPVT